MKKTISIFILLVSLILTSCGKERINQLNNLNASTSDAIQPLEPAVKNEESWGKWTSRQWKDNKGKWLGSVIGFALVVTGCYFVYNKCFNSSSTKTSQSRNSQSRNSQSRNSQSRNRSQYLM